MPESFGSFPGQSNTGRPGPGAGACDQGPALGCERLILHGENYYRDGDVVYHDGGGGVLARSDGHVCCGWANFSRTSLCDSALGFVGQHFRGNKMADG